MAASLDCDGNQLLLSMLVLVLVLQRLARVLFLNLGCSAYRGCCSIWKREFRCCLLSSCVVIQVGGGNQQLMSCLLLLSRHMQQPEVIAVI
jgi:hypothetical protein